MTFRRVLISLAVIFCFANANAQEESQATKSSFFRDNTEFQIRAGFSIGGNAPIPFPVEIRSIESYNPTLALALEANLTKWLGDNNIWGIRTGLKVEGRGMKTKARVKSYYTEVIGDEGEKVKGNFTGMVQTTVKNSYVTMPVLATFSLSKEWSLYAGPYFSALIEKDFSGYVYDGYLREGNPAGPKVVFEGGNKGPYDFSKDLNKFQWGFMGGGEATLKNHLKLFGELNWGINDLFKKGFETVTFDMYSIYLNIGFGYTF